MEEMVLHVPFEDGYLGCKCPVEECQGYFKQMLGTGIADNPVCHCPYCGHVGDGGEFLDPDATGYLTSFATHHVFNQILDTLKQHEFDYKPHGSFGIGISMTVSGTSQPIRAYRAQEFETVVKCSRCALQYAIYGVFAYCPDCGVHNSLQILEKNLELAEKQAALSATVEGDLAEHLIAHALENEVSTFDGFGREACRLHSSRATKPDKAQNVSFQNLMEAQKRCQDLFDFDLASGIAPDEWIYACRCFQKRHLLAHKMGVIDEKYAKLADDPSAIAGRKVVITLQGVTELANVLRRLGTYLVLQLESSGPATGFGAGGTMP